jgi:hypothetical protein
LKPAHIVTIAGSGASRSKCLATRLSAAAWAVETVVALHSGVGFADDRRDEDLSDWLLSLTPEN